MGALKFGKLVNHIIASYDTNGKNIEIHFDNATCHSRRSDHWASPQEVPEGRLAQRGGWPKVRRLGQVKCTAWLNGHAENLREGLDTERCMLSLGTLGVDVPISGTLWKERMCVEDPPPPSWTQSKERSDEVQRYLIGSSLPRTGSRLSLFWQTTVLRQIGLRLTKNASTARIYGGHL